ncbi:hypothetical protein LSAT2_024084 [Lamellibrachia satsuma]|nr:hypothetical protein LSAT2_024084 [Lamellibrachia satsuma]
MFDGACEASTASVPVGHHSTITMGVGEIFEYLKNMDTPQKVAAAVGLLIIIVILRRRRAQPAQEPPPQQGR